MTRNKNRVASGNKDQVVSFPIDNSNTTPIEIEDTPTNVNEIDRLKSTLNESSKEATIKLASSVFEEITGNGFNKFTTPFKIIGMIGNAIRGKKRTPREIIEESLDKNLDSDRNQIVGGSSIVALIIGWLATNQSIYYITKPFKWIGVDKILGFLSTPLHWINTICTPPGVPIAKTLIAVQASKGIVTISVAQGLMNAILGAFNISITFLIVFSIIMGIAYILERFRIRKVIYKAMGKKLNP